MIGHTEDYTTAYLLDYDYIRNHHSRIAVDLGRQEELDADSKAIQQTEFFGQLKKLDGDGNATNVSNNQSVFVLAIFEKNNGSWNVQQKY